LLIGSSGQEKVRHDFKGDQKLGDLCVMWDKETIDSYHTSMTNLLWLKLKQPGVETKRSGSVRLNNLEPNKLITYY